MKRHLALQPLSREHHQALVLARRCERAGDPETRRAARTLWRTYWKEFLEVHFRLEEVHLLPVLEKELGLRLQEDHGILRDLGQRLDEEGQLPRAGELLRAHVRWEERVLFPWIETHVGSVALEAIEAALAGESGGGSCSLPR